MYILYTCQNNLINFLKNVLYVVYLDLFHLIMFLSTVGKRSLLFHMVNNISLVLCRKHHDYYKALHAIMSLRGIS